MQPFEIKGHLRVNWREIVSRPRARNGCLQFGKVRVYNVCERNGRWKKKEILNYNTDEVFEQIDDLYGQMEFGRNAEKHNQLEQIFSRMTGSTTRECSCRSMNSGWSVHQFRMGFFLRDVSENDGNFSKRPSKYPPYRFFNYRTNTFVIDYHRAGWIIISTLTDRW